METLPLVAMVAMAAAAAYAYAQLRGRIGRALALVAVAAGSWSFLIYVEYRIECLLDPVRFQTESPILWLLLKALNAGRSSWDPQAVFWATKVASFFVGALVVLLASAILRLGMIFPPPTRWGRALRLAARLCVIAVALLSWFGIAMALEGNAIRRKPTWVFYFHSAFWFGAALAGIGLLFYKGMLATSRMRRFQGTFFPAGLVLAVVLGGLLGFAFPDAPQVLSIAAFAPAMFSAVFFFGAGLSRLVKRRERLKSKRVRMRGAVPLFVLLQRDFGLTYQEARICEKLEEGQTSIEIRRSLEIHPNTFKIHRRHIYAKTIERGAEGASNRRDKWQQLAQWLRKLDRS